MNIRLMGTPEECEQVMRLLQALEQLQQTGEVSEDLKAIKVTVVDPGRQVANRAPSQLVRQYLEVRLK